MIKYLTKALGAMRHSGAPRTMGFSLPRTRINYRKEAGDCLDTSVVMAPVQWMQRALPEARLCVKKLGPKKGKSGGDMEDMREHPMLALIQKPNPFYADIALWWGTMLSLAIDGNAYWIIVRNGAARPSELWYVPHWMMEPLWPQDGSTYISHYRYSPGGGSEPMRIEPEDVVHFRYGINPRNIRKGLSPIDSAIREIFMDNESSNFVSALLRNMGVPGVVISPKGGAMPTPDDVLATKLWFQEQFGGDRRGAPLVMGAPTDVQPYGFNPQQMNMSEARDIAEERVCALLGIPAAVVGFGSGLQSTKVGATMEELRKLAWHNGILPMARLFADELQRSLLPLFGNDAGLSVDWDTSQVAALQDDEDKETERWNKRVLGGWVTVAEARAATGLEVNDSHRIYLRGISVLEIPESGARPAAPEAAPKVRGLKASAVKARAGDDQYKRGAAYALMLQRQERALQAAFEKPLMRLFESMGAEAGKAARSAMAVKSRKAGHKSDDDDGADVDDDAVVKAILKKLGIAPYQGTLRELYQAQYLEVAKTVSDAAERAGLGVSLPDPVARSIIAAGGKRSGMIDIQGQSRDAMFDALAQGRSEGEGAEQLAKRIAAQVEGGPWQSAETRARIIARTETKYAQNISTVERAKAGGVELFIVFDGRLGPGRSKPEHIERDGSIVTADEAETMADEEHPNGTLSFAPYFDDQDFDGQDFEETTEDLS